MDYYHPKTISVQLVLKTYYMASIRMKLFSRSFWKYFLGSNSSEKRLVLSAHAGMKLFLFSSTKIDRQHRETDKTLDIFEFFHGPFLTGLSIIVVHGNDK
jgi:hypothetical protein